MKHDSSKSRSPKVQGEGDYASAKKYNEESSAFAHSGKVEQAAKKAAPRNAQEKSEMQHAESEGHSHAKNQEEKGENGSDLSSGNKPEKRAPGKKSSDQSAPGR